MVVIILIVIILLVGNVFSTMTTSKLIIKEAEEDDIGGNLTAQIIVANLGGTPVEGNIEIRMMINNSSVTLDRKNKLEGFKIWEVNVVINESYGSMVYLFVDERLEDSREMDVCYDVIITILICSISLYFLPKKARKKQEP